MPDAAATDRRPPPSAARRVAQEVAAEMIGLPCGALTCIERGTHEPSDDTATKLASWLD